MLCPGLVAWFAYLRWHGDKEVWIDGATNVRQGFHTQPYLISVGANDAEGAEKLYNEGWTPTARKDDHYDDQQLDNLQNIE